VNSTMRARAAALVTAALIVSSVATAQLGAAAENPAPSATDQPTPSSTAEPAESGAGSGSLLSSDESGTVLLSGKLVTFGEGEGSDQTARAFHVDGLGYAMVDVSGLSLAPLTGQSTTLRVRVPAALGISDDDTVTFKPLQRYSLDVAPLTVVSEIADNANYAPMINQVPAVAAVHKIYLVFMTPSNISGSSAAASQTVAKMQTSIAHASALWSDQSAGKITFTLEATAGWYKSSYSCYNPSDTTKAAIFAEGADFATNANIGYSDSDNNHLVMNLPAGSDCGNWAGFGSLGSSINDGGHLWEVGSDDTYAQSTLAHELGHNLSMSHSNWLDCTSSNPHPGLYAVPSGCTANEYGDAVDVMGGGVLGTGGALSSTSAIRSGIWPTSAYANAPKGTTTYTLNAVTSHSGLRAVIVEDSDGANYFVEFRNLTGEDAQYGGNGCPLYTTACIPTTAGVRVLRLSQDLTLGGYSFKGLVGDSSLLIGRTVSGVKRGNYTAGESFQSQSSGGVIVNVTSINAGAGTATVQITKPANSVSTSKVKVYRSVTAKPYAYSWRVGDTLQMLIGSYWKADTYSFQWYRNGKAISGATKQNYTLTSTDKGQCIRAKLTGKSGSSSASAIDPSPQYCGYGPIASGTIQTGTVAIITSASPWTANAVGWGPSSAKISYQWYRNGAAISGATSSTYLAGNSDRDKTLTVKVTGSKSGYTTASVTSTGTPDLTIDSSGTPVVSGTPEVGQTLSVNTLSYTYPGGGAVASPTRTYQWYRSGSAISGAVGSTYTLTSSDYAKTMSVRVLGSVAGYIPHTATSASTAKVAHGTFHGTLAAPIVTETDLASRTLTAALAPGSVTETPISLYYQWYRGTSAISKATKSTYKLTSSDYAKDIKVKVTVKKSSYTSIVLYSVPAGYSLIPSATPPVISGTLAIGQTIAVTPVTTTLNGSSASPSYTYRWYRSGKAISGATANTYTLAPADAGKTIKVLVTSSLTGAIGWSKSSASTAVIGSSTVPMAGWNAQANATVSLPTASRVLSVTGTGITEAGVKQTYQWYRGTSAISKATKSSYTLTSSDTNKLVSVRVITSKATFTSITKTSVPTNYTVVGSTVPQISDTTPAVGDTLSIIMPTYTVLGSPYTLTGSNVTYRWYRSGKAISGATANTYVVTTADKSKTLKVTVTVTAPGYLTSSLSSASTSKATS
jgi:hypothetical protein